VVPDPRQCGCIWEQSGRGQCTCGSPTAPCPRRPYQVEDNENTWLTQTDLVFIDPVGTGYSRVTKPELLKNYLGLKGDTAAVGKFIRLYLDRYEALELPAFSRRRKLRYDPRLRTIRIHAAESMAWPLTAWC